MKFKETYTAIMNSLFTPFVYQLDNEYYPIDISVIQPEIDKIKSLPYVTDLHDCDNSAFGLKGRADEKCNAVGIVIGWHWRPGANILDQFKRFKSGGLHAWNCVITKEGIKQIEPQTGVIFDRKFGYLPILVII